MDLSGSPLAMITAEKVSNNGLGRSFLSLASSSSSNSASYSESLFAFFDHSSTSALFSSSSSAFQSFAAAAVKWVGRSGNKNWDSPMWQLGIFKCSENDQVNHRYLVKSSRFFPVMVLYSAVQNIVYRAQIVGIAQGGLTRTMCHILSQYVRDLSFFPWTLLGLVHGPWTKIIKYMALRRSIGPLRGGRREGIGGNEIFRLLPMQRH